MERDILPQPPDKLKALSNELCEHLRGRIAKHGAMPFREWMESVLYEPGLGYYSAGLQKFGAGGDFITAPELGDLFGQCLAAQINQITSDGLSTGSWRVLEIGAGTARLAGQLLDQLHDQPGFEGYDILERSADLRAVQRTYLQENFPQHLDAVRWLDAPPVAEWNGVVAANEVVDALPVDRFRIGPHGVEEVTVTFDDGRFTWDTRPAPETLQTAVNQINATLKEPLAEGYVSEVTLQLESWLGGVTATLRRGAVLLVDYGYPRREYYLPERRDGTLVCHYRHRAHGNPFWWPGLQDISAFVDFTALAEAADQAHLEVLGYTSQALFLLGTGGLQNMAQGNPEDPDFLERAAEARELLMPGNMGEKFGVMVLGRDLPMEMSQQLVGFSVRDLRHRL